MRERTPVALAALVIGLAAGFSTANGFAASLNASSAALTLYRTCVVTATPSSTTAVIDSTVRQSDPTTNYGTINTMDVSIRNIQNRRIYVWFNLSGCSPSIPAAAEIRRATLRLWTTVQPSVCRTVDIFRVTSSRTETGITWNNQPFGTSINNPPTSQRTDSFDVGTPTGCENSVDSYITGATVTADVAAFVGGSATNYGWMLRDDAEDPGAPRTSTYTTKNPGTLAQAPQLVITYVASS